MTQTERLTRAQRIFDAADSWLRRQRLGRAERLGRTLAKIGDADRWLAGQVILEGNRFKYRGHWFPVGALNTPELRGRFFIVSAIDGTEFHLRDFELAAWRTAFAKTVRA